MKKIVFLMVFLTVLILSCNTNNPSGYIRTCQVKETTSLSVSEQSIGVNIADEVKMLQAVFAADVSSLAMTDQAYLEKAVSYAKDKLGQSAHKQDSQYFVFVDRNAQKQNIMVGFYDTADGSVSVIGWDKVSTGNPNRTKHYITPTGIFENNIKHMSYRAQGTRNKKGWMGLGVKGSRVWAFGRQATVKKGSPFYIQMSMHATDPKFGEPRLGKVDSKGCIRVSAKMNKFLDSYGIIDKDYEDHPKHAKRVFRKDRTPVSLPGWYLVIGDFE